LDAEVSGVEGVADAEPEVRDVERRRQSRPLPRLKPETILLLRQSRL
jgi:hypothetical protein